MAKSKFFGSVAFRSTAAVLLFAFVYACNEPSNGTGNDSDADTSQGVITTPPHDSGNVVTPPSTNDSNVVNTDSTGTSR